jgi:murein DD-endopeptidase MepM/ murein hydrolase activator NlpD
MGIRRALIITSCVPLLTAAGCATVPEDRISTAQALRNEMALSAPSASEGGPVEVRVVPKREVARAAKPVAPSHFVWPLAPVVVNSPFGHRFHPISGTYVFHAGLDLEAYKRQRVVSAFAGRVVYAGRNGAHGNHVEVQHSKRYVTRYSHLAAVRVSVGDRVDKGAVIGTAGATGHTTGVHLHFELWKDGHPADPLDLLPDPDGPRTLVELSPR